MQVQRIDLPRKLQGLQHGKEPVRQILPEIFRETS
jgi:hypothetical protein